MASMGSRRRQRRPESAADPTASGTTASPAATSIDDETRRALALFNERLAKQAEDERAQKRVEKAVRAKDQAAAHVRALEADTKATAEQRAEAAAAYRAAIDALDRARRGDESAEVADAADTAAPAAEAAEVAEPAAPAAGESPASEVEPDAETVGER